MTLFFFHGIEIAQSAGQSFTNNAAGFNEIVSHSGLAMINMRNDCDQSSVKGSCKFRTPPVTMTAAVPKYVHKTNHSHFINFPPSEFSMAKLCPHICYAMLYNSQE
jgi:hypothetical protein